MAQIQGSGSFEPQRSGLYSIAMTKRDQEASAIDKFAEDLGSILGSAQSKAESWLGQRQQIAKQLTQIRDEASNLLSKLTGGVASMAVAVRRGRRGRPPGRAKKAGPGRPKGRTASAAARRKMSIAAKKRWAARRAAAENATEKKIDKKIDKKAEKKADKKAEK